MSIDNLINKVIKTTKSLYLLNSISTSCKKDTFIPLEIRKKALKAVKQRMKELKEDSKMVTETTEKDFAMKLIKNIASKGFGGVKNLFNEIINAEVDKRLEESSKEEEDDDDEDEIYNDKNIGKFEVIERYRGGESVKYINFKHASTIALLKQVIKLNYVYDDESHEIVEFLAVKSFIKLDKKYKELKNDTKKAMIKPLLDYITPKFKKMKASYDVNIKENKIEYSDLWLYFNVNDKIIFNDMGVEFCGEAKSCYYENGWDPGFNIKLKYFVYDGDNFREFFKVAKIRPYKNTKFIENLSVKQISSNEVHMINERSDKIKNILSMNNYYCFCNGNLVVPGLWGPIKKKAKGRVIIDSKSFYQVKPNSKPRKENEIVKITEDNKWMISPWLKAFSFYAKAWGEVMITDLEDIKFSNLAFENLVLPPRSKVKDGKTYEVDTKETIKSLVINKNNTNFTDMIQDKGGGIIFLLHGPPGVGKTLTAQAISELLERPLYSVSVGELGTEPNELEKNLGEILEIANVWDAVLLIDEADIFLEKRTKQDMQRNAIISVFLRMLEYYQGVLFLTTNRIEEFDPAFFSRISMSISYPELTVDDRFKVWSNLLKIADISLSEDDIRRLSKNNINGREIKNAIKITISIASDKNNIKVDDFEKVIIFNDSFKESIESENISLDNKAESVA